MRAAIDRLRRRLATVVDLNAAQAVLGWDQETYMPPGGVQARARQLATLGRLAHERFTDDAVGRLIEAAAAELAGGDPDGDDARLLQVAARDYDRATRLPADLVEALARAAALSQQAWKEARRTADFAAFRPHLEEVLDLTRAKAEALGFEETPYDALLDEYEPGMRSDRIAAVFATVRQRLVPIVRRIAAAPAVDDACLHRSYPEPAQWELGLQVAREIGFDLEAGRQDRSAHPFSTNFSIRDARITTRLQEDFLPTALFGTLHEAGHAMYEQGVDPALEGTILASGTSLGIHESQSRLWENLVGRSRPFWVRVYPRLQRAFPEALSEVGVEAFYRAINRVTPSLIRVEADEVTYNLHVMLRFELEKSMVEGRLEVADLPDAWNDAMRGMLGLVPSDDAEGVLQDVHWSAGLIGYFPTYALGNLISVQLFEAARSALGDLDDQIEHGEFAPLLGWLRSNIHRHGRKFSADELLQRSTGGGLDPEPWLAYVHAKFGEIYEL